MNLEKPYYAVIFTSQRTDIDEGYTEMAQKMIALAKEQSGFMGEESARNDIGITISYWETLEAIALWKKNTDHLLAQSLGKEKWYEWYNVRVCKVEYSYSFNRV